VAPPAPAPAAGDACDKSKPGAECAAAPDPNADAPVVAQWRVKSRAKGMLELLAHVERRGLLRETLKVTVQIPPELKLESGEAEYVLHPIPAPGIDERLLRFSIVKVPERPLILAVDGKGETFTLHATSDYRFAPSKLPPGDRSAKAPAPSPTQARP
jgi:hypothetical protein